MKKTLFSAIGLAMLLAMAASGCDRCDDPANPECEGVVAWAFLDSSLQKITIDYRTYFPKDSNLFTGRKIR